MALSKITLQFLLCWFCLQVPRDATPHCLLQRPCQVADETRECAKCALSLLSNGSSNPRVGSQARPAQIEQAWDPCILAPLFSADLKLQCQIGAFCFNASIPHPVSISAKVACQIRCFRQLHLPRPSFCQVMAPQTFYHLVSLTRPSNPS